MIMLSESSLQRSRPPQAAAEPSKSGCPCMFCAPAPATPSPAVAQRHSYLRMFLEDVCEGLLFALACVMLGTLFVSEQLVRLVSLLDWRGVDRVLTFCCAWVLFLVAAYLVCELVWAFQAHPELF